jgi:hypothetical protein
MILNGCSELQAAYGVEIMSDWREIKTQADIDALKGDSKELDSKRKELEGQLDKLAGDKAQVLTRRKLLDEQIQNTGDQIKNTEAQIAGFEDMIAQEEQALADGSFALALGLTLHLGLPPFVTGSPLIVDVLTNQLPAITGGKLIIETETKPAAHRIEEVILEKRKGLGLQ